MRTTTDKRQFNPLNDFLFYKVMGEKGDEVQLLGFLNAVLCRTGKPHFTSVEILEDKTFTPEIVGAKGSILDVRAVLQGGTRVNVEVQLRNQGNMDKRSLFYWSREYTASLGEGLDYRELPDVISINIVNFSYLPSSDFHTCFHLREDRQKDLILTSALEIHFLDMVKYRKQAGKDNLEDPLHRWLVWFNDGSPPELVTEVVKMDKAIQAANERMVYVTGDKEAIRAYEMRMMALSDMVSERNYVREQGLEEGRAEGRVKGHAEGRAEEKLEIARKMKARGWPLEEIAENTGLSPQAVEDL